MGIGKTITITALAAAIGAGTGYIVHEAKKVPQERPHIEYSISQELDLMRERFPQKYMATKQYVIDDIVRNPYDNKPEIRKIVEVALRTDQKQTIYAMMRYYGDEIKSMLPGRD